jgi:hypothetical protein
MFYMFKRALPPDVSAAWTERNKVERRRFCQAFCFTADLYAALRKKMLDSVHEHSHPAVMMDTITYRARIESAHIGYLNSIIESYDGIAVVRTLDAPAGIIELWLPAEFESVVTDLMHALAPEIGIQYFYKATQRLSD